MIAVDSNVLVRLLVKDDAAQTRRVVRLFEHLDASGERAFVSDVVVCEVVWVLRAAYGFDRKEIAGTMEKVAAARQLAFDAPEKLLRALKAFASGRGDLADYLIREHTLAAGCDRVVTFDKALLEDAGFAAP